MSWPLVALKDCCRVVSGATPKTDVAEYWDGEHYWVTPKDLSSLDGIYFAETPERITDLGLNSCSAEILPVGSVLFSSRAPIGHIAITQAPMCTNQGFKSLVPGPKVDALYLYYCIKNFTPELQALGNGATFKEVSKKIVEGYRIPLPPLATQRHIAKVLEQADHLRRQAQQMEKELDRLALALFLEMFGDPVGNPKGWPIARLGQHLEAIESGWSPTCSEQQAAPGEWGVLKLGAVTSCTYRESENKKLPDELSPRLKLEVKAGDLLFSRKNTYTLVAASAYIRKTQGKIMLSDLIFRLVPGKMLSPIYLWGLLVNPSFRSEVQNLAGGAAGSMPNISKAKLGDKEIPLPPIETQEQYAEAVQSLWEQLDLHKQRADQLDCLFNSLLQRAFKGELTPKLA